MFSRDKSSLVGQMTMYGLVSVFVMLVVYSQLYPTIDRFLSDLLNISDPASKAVLSLIPFIIGIVILLSTLSYLLRAKGQ